MLVHVVFKEAEQEAYQEGYSWMTITENETFSGIKGDKERKREEKKG